MHIESACGRRTVLERDTRKGRRTLWAGPSSPNNAARPRSLRHSPFAPAVSEEGGRLGDPGGRVVSVKCCGGATRRRYMRRMQEQYGAALRRWRRLPGRRKQRRPRLPHPPPPAHAAAATHAGGTCNRIRRIGLKQPIRPCAGCAAWHATDASAAPRDAAWARGSRYPHRIGYGIYSLPAQPQGAARVPLQVRHTIYQWLSH